MTGGTELNNVFREDDGATFFERPDKLIEAFPEREKGQLKIPPIF